MQSSAAATPPGSTPAALDGVRVLDLSSGIAGPFGARLLGDLGADVIKIEPPGGEEGRTLAPLAPAAPEAERSLLFQYLNRNKRGIVLDLADSAHHGTLRALVERSDILIESYRPGQLKGWGIGVDLLRQWNPRLVVTSVTDFGQEGPYAQYTGSDLVHQAMAGIMQISGSADRPPLKHGLNQAGFCAGLNVAYTSLAAFNAAVADGIGEHVDLSIFEALASELVMCETYYTFMGAVQGRRWPSQDPFAGGPFPTRKGYLSIQSGGPTPLEVYAEVFRDPRLLESRFISNKERPSHLEALREVLAECVKDRDAKEIFLDASKRRLLTGVVQGAPELLACEQLEARGFYQEMEHPATGRMRFPTELVKLSATPMAVRRRSPLLGEHQREVLDAIAAEPPRPAPTPRAGGARLPLAGLRVLDLSTVVAVPYLAGLLGDLGAEVIKIEAPHKLCQTRRGVFTTYLDCESGGDSMNRSGLFIALNRNKRSLVLDMAKPEGREVFKELVAKADIVVDNFTPRVMKGWGLTYDELRKIRPSLIMLSNTGYGSTGPWSNFPSQGTTLEVTMGIAAYTGYRGDKPWKVGQSYPDFLACWSGLTAIFAALHHLRTRGEGQWIDMGMYQVGASLVPEPVLQYQHDGTQPERIGNEDARFVPSNVYPAAGDDRWVAVTVKTDAQWAALAEAMGQPALATHADYATEAARRAHREQVDALVAQWMQDKDPMQAMALLQSRGVACGPVMNNRDLLLDPQMRARGFHEKVRHAEPIGWRLIMGRPYRMRMRDVKITKPAPSYAEDNRWVLREVLGWDAARTEQVIAERTVCDTPNPQKPTDSVGLAGMMKLRTVIEHDPDYRQKLGVV